MQHLCVLGYLGALNPPVPAGLGLLRGGPSLPLILSICRQLEGQCTPLATPLAFSKRNSDRTFRIITTWILSLPTAFHTPPASTFSTKSPGGPPDPSPGVYHRYYYYWLATRRRIRRRQRSLSPEDLAPPLHYPVRSDASPPGDSSASADSFPARIVILRGGTACLAPTRITSLLSWIYPLRPPGLRLMAGCAPRRFGLMRSSPEGHGHVFSVFLLLLLCVFTRSINEMCDV